MIIQIFGYIGSIAYALCSLPQAIMCIKNGHAKGFSHAYAILSLIGSILSLIYACSRLDYALMINFICGTTFWTIKTKYCYFERH